MGCSGSKQLAPAEPGFLGKEGSSDAQGLRPRQARLSLAGAYNQYESTKVLDMEGSTSGSGALDPLPSGLSVRYAYLTQRGHYPDQPNKANQDAVFFSEMFAEHEHRHLMGVFDGHGETGAECAQFAKVNFPQIFGQDADLSSQPGPAMHRALVTTNAQLHAAAIDDTLSGTTACVAMLQGDILHVANVGDSRAVLAMAMPATPRSPVAGAVPSSPQLVAVDLTSDQTPFREDERERVRAAGARVLTLDQIEGLKDASQQCWTCEANCDGDPPRLWSQAGTYPGTAFTRSIGDSVAEGIGVFAEPELTSLRITRDHVFLIVASDGIWEFLPSQRAVDIVAGCAAPEEAASALVSAAYKAWLQKEMRTDDISVVVMFFSFNDICAAGAQEGDQTQNYFKE